MINLLRGELYKIRKSKSTYICSVVIIAFVLLLYGTFVLADIQQRANGEETHGITVTVEKVQETSTSIWDDIGVLDVMQTMFGSFGIIIVAIFVSVFVCAEYANGAVKNVAGKGCSRREVFVSKYISTTIMACFMYLLMAVAVTVFGLIFIGGERFTVAIFKDLLVYVAMQLLLGIAISGIIVLINQICRNIGAGIAVSVCMILFSSFVTTGIDVFFKLLKLNVKASEFWVLDLIATCPLSDIGSSFVIRAVISVVVWITVSLAIGSFHFCKADIK